MSADIKSGNILDHIFHWIDNTKMTFTNWMPGEPNGDNTGENVVEMIYYSYAGSEVAKAGQWNDLSPTRDMAFMCSHPSMLLPFLGVTGL